MSDVLRWKRTWDHPAKVPEKVTDGSAGYDLQWVPRQNNVGVIHPGTIYKFESGWSSAIPEGHVGLIRERSSIALRKVTAVAGVIDSDFRKEIIVVLANIGNDPVYIEPLERIAQMVVVPVSDLESTEVDRLEETDRDGGFGSTGRF